MLLPDELERLFGLSEEFSQEAFLEEQALRSRATPAQQVRVYGYWRKEKPVRSPAALPVFCRESHWGEVCTLCREDYNLHADHGCGDITGRRGVFPSCEGPR